MSARHVAPSLPMAMDWKLNRSRIRVAGRQIKRGRKDRSSRGYVCVSYKYISAYGSAER